MTLRLRSSRQETSGLTAQRGTITALSICCCLLSLFSSIAVAQIGGKAGAFSRLGFGARGMGMANALTAVTSGEIVGYYNPAVLPWAEHRYAAATFGILAFDRTLNFISYSQPVKPNAGISAGIINSGVSDIDGRDSDGEPTGPLRTSENQVFLAFSARLQSGFSVGINIKFYHHHLYTDVTATKVGLDFGALVPIGESLTLGATVRDINSEYKWDTSKLYGQRGTTTTDRFPLLYTVGAAYKLPDTLGLVSFDIEASDQKTLIARVGIEYPLIKEITLRGGIDRIDLKEKGNGVRPTFGFTARTGFDAWSPAVHYAFIIEPFASSAMHIISLSVTF
ncbi:MAG: hypothetical protein HY708_02090 [Ignavibacteriae bacterium]|nr:hypothetical protein [Ignavibacteriota bacterium]